MDAAWLAVRAGLGIALYRDGGRRLAGLAAGGYRASARGVDDPAHFQRRMVLRHVRPKADWRGHADAVWTVVVGCAVRLDGMANKPISKHAILALFGMG